MADCKIVSRPGPQVLESHLLLRMQVFMPESTGGKVYNALYDPTDDTVRLYDNDTGNRVKVPEQNETILRAARLEFSKH